jgi:Ca-activated chloride channel family protein
MVKYFLLVVALRTLMCGQVSLAQAAPQPQTSKPSLPVSKQNSLQPSVLPPDVDPTDSAVPAWLRPANASSGTPETSSPASLPVSNAPVVIKEGSSFLLRTHVDEVVLPVTVVDHRQHLVTNLSETDFVVFEEERSQRITGFRQEDMPVSIGIVVDNSGSMRLKRAAVSKAVVNLVKASNPQDEVFIVNFNDEPYLDQDFTADVNLMRDALDRMDSRGGTALYDAVFVAAEHLAKGARREKKILLVVTDGEDNGSMMTLEQAIRRVQDDSGPVIYSIGILGREGRERRARRALEVLSLRTGGVAFFPKSLDEVDDVSLAVARDIRNQYTIAYKSTTPQSNGGYRKVKVMTRGFKDLQVRTKSGYFAGQRASAEAR